MKPGLDGSDARAQRVSDSQAASRLQRADVLEEKRRVHGHAHALAGLAEYNEAKDEFLVVWKPAVMLGGDFDIRHCTTSWEPSSEISLDWQKKWTKGQRGNEWFDFLPASSGWR